MKRGYAWGYSLMATGILLNVLLHVITVSDTIVLFVGAAICMTIEGSEL